MIDLREIHSVTEFQRNIKDFVGKLKRKKSPLVLTVNGRAALVVQDAASYQALLDRLERRQTESEVRISSELVAVAGAVTQLRDAILEDRDLRNKVAEHERRITALEARPG